jgi:DNA polymerase (family X)
MANLRRRKKRLPKLIEWTDLKGSLHNHSTWSDGHNTLEEIAEFMDGLGLGILGHHGPFEIIVSGERAGCETAARANQGNQKINERFAESAAVISGC